MPYGYPPPFPRVPWTPCQGAIGVVIFLDISDGMKFDISLGKWSVNPLNPVKLNEDSKIKMITITPVLNWTEIDRNGLANWTRGSVKS